MHLDLCCNSFLDILPSKIGNLKLLDYPDISHNLFAGILSSKIGMLTLLTFLDVSNNTFLGTLCSEIGKVSSLTYYYVYDYENQTTGIIPVEIGNLVQLTDLWIF
jgi:Leucine-rich repeat (LRR) protein